MSDHAPVDEDQKQLPFAEAEPGATGLELLLPLALKWGAERKLSLAKTLARQNRHGKVAFGTEASVIAERGRIPSVVCGPGHIDQAHKPDEFIALSEMARCETFMKRLMRHCEG